MIKANSSDSRNTIETILVLLLLIALMYALFEVLRVFFGVLTFALIFSVSFSQPFERLVIILKNRRKLAAVLYAVVLAGVSVMPFIYLVSAFSSHVKELILWMNQVKTHGLPSLPLWVGNLAFVGADLESFWGQLQHSPREMLSLHEHQVRGALHHVMSSGAGILGATLQFIIGIFISAFFLSGGDKMLQPLKSAVQHLLGKRDGLALLKVTTQAIKGVSIGVMGTAFIAAFISWIGLVIAGIPFALGVAALIFFLVVVQVGPLIVWIPLIIWMGAQGHTGMTIFLIVYGAFVLLTDAVLKPVLIAKSGGKIPFLVLFIGVIGGMAAWGFTGMFKGAIILAVFHTVFTLWLEKRSHRDPQLPRLADSPAG